MREIIFVTGGQRSGKSSFAQRLAESLDEKPLYLATARIWDEDFRRRVARHQADRGEKWEHIEEEKHLSKLQLEGRTVLMDCVTLWLTNIFHDNGYQLEASLAEAKREWDQFTQQSFRLIVVTNEIGMALHPLEESVRHFTDLQGWMNQYISSTADKAYFMVSGNCLQLK